MTSAFKPSVSASIINRSDILQTMKIFHDNDDVIEIRIPNAGRNGTISGYFDNYESLADAVENLAKEPFHGYYFTINPINKALLARSYNKITQYAKSSTADIDVTQLCWLPIDLDPIRPSGISSTNEEHEASLEMAKRIRADLVERGWPGSAFVLADSGNGGHLIVKIEPLDSCKENVELIHKCLDALDLLCSDSIVKVDTSTFNPARIWKVYGTPARKGDNTPERPHRMARLLEVPNVLEEVPKKLLEELAALLPSDKSTRRDSRGDDFDPEAWAKDHGLGISRVKDWNGGVLVELEVCPFNTGHRRTARIGKLASGARYFGCFHDGCKGKKWKDLRNLFGKDKKTTAIDASNQELPETADGQSVILTTDRHLQNISNDALAALIKSNSPPYVFVRSDGITRIMYNEMDVPVLEHLNEHMLRGLLARCAKYVRTKGKNQLVDHDPPIDVVRDILSLGSWPDLPPIQGIVESPVIRPDGTILNQPGYDDATRLYYAPSNNLKALEVPENHSKEDARRAADYILSEIFGDFPFKDDASRANALASLVTVIMRPLIDGNIPLALFDKPQAGTGASLLIEVISSIATGRPAHMMSAPRDDEEWRKMITSSLIEGPSIIVIDNVDGILRSSSLSRALTAKVWRDRILGRSEMIDLPQRAVWYATGNNIQIKGDLPRRSYWIRLDAQMARPWLRNGFRHEDLLGWVKNRRATILSALLIIVRSWYIAGQPPAQVRTLGGFDDWAQRVGAVLEFAGMSGFLGNRTELYDSMDQEVGQWDSFLITWREVQADLPITSAELKKELESPDETFKDLQAAMPDDIARAISKSAKSAVALGNVLSKHVDQVYPAGLKLIREEERHQKIKKWRVIDTVQPAGTDKKAKSTTIDDFAGGAGAPEHPSIIEKKVSSNVAYIERLELAPAAPAKGSDASVSDFLEHPQNVDEKPGQSNADRIDAELQLAEETRNEREEHFKTPDSKKKATCPICDDDISPGHGSRTFEGVNYCTTCSTHFAAVRASVKDLTDKNNGLGPTTTKIYKDVTGRSSRLPKMEHLPGMLRAVGAIEIDGKWILPCVQKESQPLGEGQGTTNNVDDNEHAATSADDEGSS